MSRWQDLKDNPRLRKIYKQRIEIIKLIREFFWSQGFVETDTPMAVRYASQEPHLNPIPINIIHPNGGNYRFYLHTSPEYALKKLLCAGWNKIFEICKCFRNMEDFGGSHNPEFTMLEWYRAPGIYLDFMDDMEKLFKFLAKKLGVGQLTRQGREIPVEGEWERVSMRALWQKHIGINLDDYLGGAPRKRLKELAAARGYQVNAKDAFEDLFFKIFLNEIEPYLGWEKPVFVYDYPASMASLSRLCTDPRYAERVECYAGGLELCNGFGELTDAEEQKNRLEKDREFRAALGKETWPVDPDFISALRAGMPPAAGIALGVDRVILLFTGAKDINEVIFNSARDQVDQ